MRNFDPAQVQAISGVTTDQLRDWRRRGFLEGLGHLTKTGWQYWRGDIAALTIAKLLVRAGMDMGPAVRMARSATPIIGTLLTNDPIGSQTSFPGFIVGWSEPGLEFQVREFVSLTSLDDSGIAHFHVVDCRVLSTWDELKEVFNLLREGHDGPTQGTKGA